MRNMGENVEQAFRYFDIDRDPNNLVVLTDINNLKVGCYRIMAGVCFFGHQGLNSISQTMGAFDGFTRIGIGIGRPSDRS